MEKTSTLSSCGVVIGTYRMIMSPLLSKKGASTKSGYIQSTHGSCIEKTRQGPNFRTMLHSSLWQRTLNWEWMWTGSAFQLQWTGPTYERILETCMNFSKWLVCLSPNSIYISPLESKTVAFWMYFRSIFALAISAYQKFSYTTFPRISDSFWGTF